jgi:hypothetical protein
MGRKNHRMLPIVTGFGLCINFGPRRIVTEKVESGYERGYAQGNADGTRVGMLDERAEWCAPERSRKPGDMTLKCLKLFLDDAPEQHRYMIKQL